MIATRTRYDHVIVGGGVIGSALAAKLANHGCRVAVLEPKIDHGLQASQNNAGAGRRLHWTDPTLTLIDKTLRYFAQLGDAIDLRMPGYLWLHSEQSFAAAQKNAREIAARFHVGMDVLTGLREIQTVMPELACLDALNVHEPAFGIDLGMPAVVGAIHSPNDVLFDPNLVVRHYREAAKAAGADFFPGFYVTEAKTEGATQTVVAKFNPQGQIDDEREFRSLMSKPLAQVKAGSGEISVFQADQVVWCTGAWANLMFPDLVRPQRRQNAAFIGPRLEKFLGFVALDDGTYFHPESRQGTNSAFIAGKALPAPFDPYDFIFDSEGRNFFVRHILHPVSHRLGAAFNENLARYLHAYAGLYPQTADGCAIIDRDRIIGVSGHGMMLSWGAADLYYRAFVAGEPDALSFAAQFSQQRFAAGKPLESGLHI